MSERVTHEEARQILSRFNASHFNNPTEHARYSIPARPDHDDDCRLATYIRENEKGDASAAIHELEKLRKELGVLAASMRSEKGWSLSMLSGYADQLQELADESSTIG